MLSTCLLFPVLLCALVYWFMFRQSSSSASLPASYNHVMKSNLVGGGKISLDSITGSFEQATQIIETVYINMIFASLHNSVMIMSVFTDLKLVDSWGGGGGCICTTTIIPLTFTKWRGTLTVAKLEKHWTACKRHLGEGSTGRVSRTSTSTAGSLCIVLKPLSFDVHVYIYPFLQTMLLIHLAHVWLVEVLSFLTGNSFSDFVGRFSECVCSWQNVLV